MQATFEQQHTCGMFAQNAPSFPRAVDAPVFPPLALPDQTEPPAAVFPSEGFHPRAFLVGLAAAMAVLALIQVLF